MFTFKQSELMNDALWNFINIIHPPSNVLSGFNILGGYMKEEALKAHDEVVKGADVALYDAGFSDGQAGAQASGITKDEMDAAVTQAKADGLAEGQKAGFEKGAASVPVASPDGKFTQEEMDKYAASKIDQLPADTTPFSQADMDALNAKLTAAETELAKVTSDDAADKAAIAAGQDIIAAVRAALEGKVTVVAKV